MFLIIFFDFFCSCLITVFAFIVELLDLLIVCYMRW